MRKIVLSMAAIVLLLQPLVAAAKLSGYRQFVKDRIELAYIAGKAISVTQLLGVFLLGAGAGYLVQKKRGGKPGGDTPPAT